MLETFHGVLLLASLVVRLSRTRDYWKSERLHLPIVVKEARALVNVLKAGRSFVCNMRVEKKVRPD